MGHSPVVPPRSLSPYGVLAHDPVALVRYKVGQRAVKGNPLAMGARRRLRDEFAVLDPTLSSQCTRQEFLSVLRLYNIDMKDQDWGAFAQKHPRRTSTAKLGRTPHHVLATRANFGVLC